MRTTIEEKEYHLVPAHRNPRIEPCPDGDQNFAMIVLDDDGYGEHTCMITASEAEELIALGMRRATEKEIREREERCEEIENERKTICGNQVQHDASGVGHNWRNIDAEDIPAIIREEIEGEMIDGGSDECDDFVASNGLHYRW